jgi:methylenetetrahydrofolate dehydrogenase (NADP+) / methenyltetrahydrofolate cyclohydrolase
MLSYRFMRSLCKSRLMYRSVTTSVTYPPILDGRPVAAQIREDVAARVRLLRNAHGITPCLATINCTGREDSGRYVRMKQEACQSVGIKSIAFDFPPTIEEEFLASEVQCLSDRGDVNGIIVQFPLPYEMDTALVLNSMDATKDVDGLHPRNVAQQVLADRAAIFPCTPLACMAMLEFYNIKVSGANIVIIGSSNLVGKPLFHALLAREATVTMCHAHTDTAMLQAHCLLADIIVCAVGLPNFLPASFVRSGCTVLDVGINVVDGKVVGDVQADDMRLKGCHVTPVPNGIGPLTIGMLLHNTVRCTEMQISKDWL